MGYRGRRRGGGGGGGGHRGHGGGGGFFSGEPNGIQPGDDVGNRKSFKGLQLPPEDIGNRRDPEEAAWVPDDDCGNRIDLAPTHEISGVLLEVFGNRRRKRFGQKSVERVGRYLVGGVNPIIAGGMRPVPQPAAQQQPAPQPRDDAREARAGDDEGAPSNGSMDADRGGRRRRGGRGGGGGGEAFAPQEANERRAQRFFDFVEDDRFEYQLKTTPDAKRVEAETAVQKICEHGGRDAIVKSRVIEDGDKPKVLVTIEDRGPSSSLPPERRSGGDEPLFALGNAALMSLNYLVNKIVNRYPDDRIRLAVLPAADEPLYVEALAEHRRARTAGEGAARDERPAGDGAPRDDDGAARDERPSAAREDHAAAPAPVAAAAAEDESSPAEAASPASIDDQPAAKPKRRTAAKKAYDDETPAAKKAKADDDDAPAPKKKKAAAKKPSDDDDVAPKKKAAAKKTTTMRAKKTAD